MNYTDSEADLIVVDGIKELNYKQKKLFAAAINPNVGERENYRAELIKILGDGVYNKVKALFCDENYREGILKGLEKRGVFCVTYKSADYPPLLKETGAPPLVLYGRGRRELLNSRLFGVVGSRRTPAKMVEECKRFCAELSNYLTIVSGVADGGDSAAVTGALTTGNVICVLPCGHDGACCSNPNLLARVEKEGLTLSEFVPDTPVQRHTFRLRNRIIAGLCEGVLVVSAGEKSGTLSTAEYAADYNRDVFAFPYGVGAPYGAGCNRLIKRGATLCDSVDDVLFALGIDYKSVAAETFEAVDGDEAAILKLLKEQGEMHAEKIASALNMKLTDVVTTCSMLEIKGLVVRTGGNSFAEI